MKTTPCAISIVLLIVLPAAAQQPQELLHDVPPGQAQRLEEYNAAFIQDTTFLASRYRIVRVDTNLLFQERDITVTPFPGLVPIELIWLETRDSETRQGEIDGATWVGHYKSDPLFPVTGEYAFRVKINLHAWDITPEGHAEISSRNRFEYSPRWSFDANDNPVLERAPGSESGIAASPPPQTAQDIARHKRLKSLDKHAFFSTRAVFDVPNRSSRYVLTPLKFTPRYSVIYEVDRDGLPDRREPGQQEPLSSDESALLERYRTFREQLPSQENKEIRGDLR